MSGRHRTLDLDDVAVGAQAPVTPGASDPGLRTAVRGRATARGRAGAATIPTPRPGGRSPRPARPGPRHRLRTGQPVACGSPVALVVIMAVVGAVALIALVPLGSVFP